MSKDPTHYLALDEKDPSEVGIDPGDPFPVPQDHVEDAPEDPELEEIQQRGLRRLQEEER